MNEQQITVDDPRVQEISEWGGMEPSAVIEVAEHLAEKEGETVGQELDEAAGTIELNEAIEAMDEALDLDEDDSNEDDDSDDPDAA